MPLDPSIILGGRQAPIASPFELMDQITRVQAVREQTEDRRAAIELRRQAAEDARTKAKLRAQVGQAYQQSVTPDPTTGRPNVDFRKLWSLVPPEAIPDLLQEFNTQEANQLDIATKELALNTGREKFLGTVGQRVVAAKGAPSLWQSQLLVAKNLKAIDDATYQVYSQLTDPKDILEAAQSFVLGAGGEAVKPQLVERVNAQGQTEKVWVIPKVGESYPQAPTTTGAGYRWAIPPGGKQAQLMSAEEIRRTGATNPPPNFVPSYQWATPPGTTAPVLMTPQEIRDKGATSPSAGGPGAGATEAERKGASFYGQMEQALTTINALESQLTEADLYQIQSLPQEGFTGWLNRSQMSENAKRYIQAFNQFTEARLRPVSGAAIADSEYARDRATYGKQYGETSDLARQRTAARQQALESLRVMGGRAIDEKPAEKKTDPLGIR